MLKCWIKYLANSGYLFQINKIQHIMCVLICNYHSFGSKDKESAQPNRIQSTVIR